MSTLPVNVQDALDQSSFRDVHRVLRSSITIVDVLDNHPWFRGAADWTAWRAFLCALFGLPMTDQEYSIFVECTGRKDAPTKQAREAYVPVGRRGRKSAIGALIAAYIAEYRDLSPGLAPKERALIPILSDKRDNAQAIMGYAKAIFSGPQMSQLLDGEPTGDTIPLENRVDIVIRAASLSAGRSRATPCAILDEIAFWSTDDTAAEPDVEILRGILPAMATFTNPLLVALSSPYAKRGVLHQAYKDHWGQNGDVLVWKAPTLRMNTAPTVALHVETETAKDPIAAAAEYGAEFREDVIAFVRESAIEAVTDSGVTVRPPVPGVVYIAFVDPSGGSSDSFTLGIGHWNEETRVSVKPVDPLEPVKKQQRLGTAVLDRLAAWRAPFKPTEVVKAACRVLREYGINTAVGDHYAGEWPADLFKLGVHEDSCSQERDDRNACDCPGPWKIAYGLSDVPKSQIYSDFLPLVNAESVSLLDDKVLRAELVGLERRVARGGRDSIDHKRGDHDDVANVAAGVLRLVDRSRIRTRVVVETPTTVKALVQQQRAEYLRNVRGNFGKAKTTGWVKA